MTTGGIGNPSSTPLKTPPEQHFELGPNGPTGELIAGRRPSESFIPVPPTRKGHGGQGALDLDATGERRERNDLVNSVRHQVDLWRARSYPWVTPITRKLLQYWAAGPPERDDPVLFCQREATETAIFLAEVAGRHGYPDWRSRLAQANALHNEGLPRVGIKMATGSGKTVVMAMIIAWQTLNKVTSPSDARFTKRFLVVTPGITIRDRLRVLHPEADGNYYRERDLVPAECWGALTQAQIVVTNYHTFLLRDAKELKGVAANTRKLLVAGKSVDPFRETPEEMVSRLLRDLGSGGKGEVAVLNDEAHHCYQDRPLDQADAQADEPDAEARERNRGARVWFNGLKAVRRRVGVKAVYDLSATPFYLSGSGYNEGYIFPWVVSDFKKAAAREIDTFKAELRRRDPGADVERLTDEDLLREVMNTVGKRGKLGEQVRCVVSVAMLTEGWDANTVTHILGIRRFGSQLLCEQVIGRGLRRRSYATNEAGLFEPEYAEVYGVPFAFIPSDRAIAAPPPRPPAVMVEALPEREHLRIAFPKLDGYRVEVPDEELFVDFDGDASLRVDHDLVALWTRTEGVVGEASEQDLERLRHARAQQVAYKVARVLVQRHFVAHDGAERPWLFPRLVEVTRDWLGRCVTYDPGASVGMLLLAEGANKAAEKVFGAIVAQKGNRPEHLQPILRRFDPQGSTDDVCFPTRKVVIEATKSHVNRVVLDGPRGNTWEERMAGLLEAHPQVGAYVKNDHLGFAIPCVHAGRTHEYRPDFLVRLVPEDGDELERTWVDPKAGHISLEEYAGKWLPGRTDLRPATRGKYTQLLRLHILPRLGSAHVGSLAPSTIRAWYLELFEAHPVTADDSYRVLRAILNTAVADQCVAVNPCKVKGAGQVSSAERPTASLAEVAAAVAAMPERYQLAVLLATWCQLRPGELLALQRADVDLLHATIRVERAWVPPPGGKAVIGPPKSEKGSRTLAIPANMLPALREHLERFTGPETSAWLFPGKGATPVNPRTLERHWERARRAADRPDLHLHDLRHSGLTWAAASGATLAELMRGGGHATPAAALRYQHASQDRDEVIASALAELATRAEVMPISERDSSAENPRPL